MARPTSVSVAYNGTASTAVPLNWRSPSFAVSVRVVNTGDVVSKVEYTFDNVLAGATPTWIVSPSSTLLESITGSEVGAIAFPCTAIRVAIISGTSGSATMTVLEAT